MKDQTTNRPPPERGEEKERGFSVAICEIEELTITKAFLASLFFLPECLQYSTGEVKFSKFFFSPFSFAGKRATRFQRPFPPPPPSPPFSCPSLLPWYNSPPKPARDSFVILLPPPLSPPASRELTDKREQEEKGRGERGKHSVSKKKGGETPSGERFHQELVWFLFFGGVSSDVGMTFGEFLVHAVWGLRKFLPSLLLFSSAALACASYNLNGVSRKSPLPSVHSRQKIIP